MSAQSAVVSDAAWIAFGSALLGAAVGGLASSAGALFTARRQAAFDARRQIFLELIPAFTASRSRGVSPMMSSSMRPPQVVVTDKTMSPGDALDAMKRTAVLAGRKERLLVGRVRTAYDLRIAPRTKGAEVDDEGNVVTRPDLRDDEEAALQDALAKLEDHLQRKLE